DLTAEAERLGDLATCYRWVSDLQSARSLAERALTLARRVGIQHLAGLLLGWLAHFSADEGDGRTALRLSNEAVSIAEELGIPEHRLFALFAKARALRLISRDEAARELLNDLLAQYEFKYGKAFGAEVTEELASLEKTTGNTYRAVVLWAAATRARQDLRIDPPPNETTRLSKEITHAREQLGERPFAKAWNVGYRIEPEDLALFANSNIPTPLSGTQRPVQSP